MPTVTLNPIADTYVLQGSTAVMSQVNGASGALLLQQSGGKNNGEGIIIIDFDATSIPSNALYESVVLRLYCYSKTAPGATATVSNLWQHSSHVNGFGITDGWQENQTSWNIRNTILGTNYWALGAWKGPVSGGPNYNQNDYNNDANIYVNTSTPGSTGIWWEVDITKSANYILGGIGATGMPGVFGATSNQYPFNAWRNARWNNQYTTDYLAAGGIWSVHIRRVGDSVDTSAWFYSKNHSDSTYYPQLVIKYTVPSFAFIKLTEELPRSL